MSSLETVEILNEHGEIVGTMSRGQAEVEGHITKNVLVFVFNYEGLVWIQLRPKSKKHYPGLWDISACGGVLASESPDKAAKRETLEEMGINVKLSHIETFLNIFPSENGQEERRRLSYLYIGRSDEVPSINEEVDEFKPCDPDELLNDVKGMPDSYIPSFAIELEKATLGYKNLNT